MLGFSTPYIAYGKLRVRSLVDASVPCPGPKRCGQWLSGVAAGMMRVLGRGFARLSGAENVGECWSASYELEKRRYLLVWPMPWYAINSVGFYKTNPRSSSEINQPPMETFVMQNPSNFPQPKRLNQLVPHAAPFPLLKRCIFLSPPFSGLRNLGFNGSQLSAL